MTGKRRRGFIRRCRVWLGTVPHLFAKLMVLHCVACGTIASFYALRILSRTGHDGSGLLAVILGFFGGELLLLCLKKILAEPRRGEGTDGLSYSSPLRAEDKENRYGTAEKTGS